MAHKKTNPRCREHRGLESSGNAHCNASIEFTKKEFFTLAERAALIGCELHRIELGHSLIYRLECCNDGAMVLSHPHDVQAAITARGAA